MKSPRAWILIAVVSFLATLLIPYLEGWNNSIWVVPPFFPATLFPLLLLFASCVALFVRCLRSRREKQTARATQLSFVIILILFSACWLIRPAVLFRCGFTHYAKTVLTPDEWRSLSRVAQEHLQPEGKLPGPRKNLWNEAQHRTLWSGLEAATRIQKLDPSLMILVNPATTEIVWGGALTGHRGVIISSKTDAPHQPSRHPHAVSIAEDIVVVVGAD